MRRVTSIDGRVLSPEQATVSVYDRGFLYGDAIYEVPAEYAEHVVKFLNASFGIVEAPASAPKGR